MTDNDQPADTGSIGYHGPDGVDLARQYVAEDEPWTELGMARRMVADHGKRLRYVPAWKRWLIWDGRHWSHDKTGEVQRCAKTTARTVLREAVDRLEGNARKQAIKAAERAESASGQRALVELAGTEPEVAIDADALDADPYLLNTPTGVLDLRTGGLGPHDPAQLLTKITTAGYDPTAPAPAFHQFLERVQPDPDMRAFLARLLGYALIGTVNEHVLPIFYGAGANGKSTLLDVVLDALGDYAATADPGLLLERGEVHPTGAADLLGRRLVVGHETDQGRRLAEGTVKRLTGGDKIKARRMREDFWEFTPSHLLIMLTNHRPTVRGDDEGIWRRLRLVPFEVQIPPQERDPLLSERLAAEVDGILAWMVAGLTAWREQGLSEPAGVQDATADYRAESDVFGSFLEQQCHIGPHYWVYASDLFSAWTQHCKAENVDAGSQTAFGKRLTERGFESAKRSRAIWRGLALMDESEEGSSW